MRSAKGPIVLGDYDGESETRDGDLVLPTKGGGDSGPLYYLPPSDGVVSGKPVFTWDEAAIQLTRAGTGWTPTLGEPVTISYAFRSSIPATMPDGVTGFQRFNSAQIYFAEQALAAWSDVANITFQRQGSGYSGEGAYNNNATILFSNYLSANFEASAFAYLPEPGAEGFLLPEGDVWVDSRDAYNINPVQGGFGVHVLVHEIGHAIGLPHPGDYNGYAGGPPTYQNDAEYWQDTRMFTAMSYFSGANTGASVPYGVGPLLHDIAAAQRLYGANMSTRSGDTVYGFNSNAGHIRYAIVDPSQSVTFAIWDGGGNDTIDLSGYMGSEIDLREEAFTSAGPFPDIYNIAIARGAVIENAIGGAGHDSIIGNDADNVLTGNASGDLINGGGGFDTSSYFNSNAAVNVNLAAGTASGGHAAGDNLTSIENLTGSAWNDTLIGAAGVNVLRGGAGDDALTGLAGADTLVGGTGFDTANYAASASGVTIDLALGTGLGSDAAGDTLSEVENIIGSAFTDTINGDASANTLRGEGGADTLSGGANADSLIGGDGDDVLIGGAGADTLAGGAGNDTADYASSAVAVNVNLNNSAGAGGDAQGDSYGSIERAIGSAFNDTLVGRDFFSNVLNGGDGNDTIRGGYGADTLIGGNGADTLDYSLSLTGVDLRLFNGAAAGGEANGDTHTGFENIIGSNTATDTLAGDDGVNFIWGGGGNETITGRDGADQLFGDAGNDALLGGAGEDVLAGGLGADTLGGGASDDLADYSASNAGVTINLATGAGTGGHAQGDTLVSIEDVIGSAFDDVIIGKANVWDNVFDGGGGNDTMTGGQGGDTFVFRLGDGSDTVTDFAGADVIRMTAWGAGFDSFAEVIAAASQNGADVVFNFGNGQTLTLQNVTLGSLNAGDFLFA